MLATFVVTDASDSAGYIDGNLTLRQAVASANHIAGHDTIEFSPKLFADGPATIELAGTELSVFEDLTIRGPGQELLSIDAGGQSRVMNIRGGVVSTTLIGLTVTGGRTEADNEVSDFDNEDAYSGGGIRFDSAGVLKLQKSLVTGNATHGLRASGGGVFSASGEVRLIDSVISSNRTFGGYAAGGGIYSNRGDVSLLGSEIQENATEGFAAGGGGVHVRHADLTLDNSSILLNHSTGQRSKGGGVFVKSGAIALVSSQISGNTTAGELGFGGGIYANSSRISSVDSTVSRNRTTGRNASGGGISMIGYTNDVSGGMKFLNSTISGNSASGFFAEGGGIDAGPNRMQLINSTVTGNTAWEGGGGIALRYRGPIPSFDILNSIVVGNSVFGSPSDLYRPIPGEGAADVRSSLIGVNDGFTIEDEGATSRFNVDWTTVLESREVDGVLVPWLKDNGGPTETIALKADSPAIDAGDSSLAIGFGGLPIDRDQRGGVFSRTSGAAIDVGAFESQSFGSDAFIVTTLRDELDFSNNDGVGGVSLREAIAVANSSPGRDSITFSEDLLREGAAEIKLNGKELLVTDSLQIDGPGRDRLAIDGDWRSRLIHVMGDDITLVLRDLTLRKGWSGEPGEGELASAEHGGGIRFDSNGFLAVFDSVLTDNYTNGKGVSGGAIYAKAGDIGIYRSDIYNNKTRRRHSPGGAIFLQSASMVMTQSVVRNNSTNNTLASRYHPELTGGGGAIYSQLGAVAIVDSTFQSNATDGFHAPGAAVGMGSGRLIVQTSLFMSNATRTSESRGGSIYSRAGSISVSGTKFLDNSSGSLGGAISSGKGKLDIDLSQFSGNASSASGGAIFNSDGPLTITRSTFSRNQTAGVSVGGGAIYSGGKIALADSSLFDNHAEGERSPGGAIFAAAGITINNSTLTGNTTNGMSPGGAIYLGSGTAEVVNSTLVVNSAERAGAIGLNAENVAGLTIHNSIIAGNNSDGSASEFDVPLKSDGTFDVRYSILGDSAGSTLVDGQHGNILDVPWNSVVESQYREPRLSKNGGPTETIALLPESLAIDAGDNDLAVTATGRKLESDQRGVPAIRIYGDSIDIGAYELQLASPEAFIVTTLNDATDLSNNSATDGISLREAVRYANASFGADTIRFEDSLFDGGAANILLEGAELLVTESLTIQGPGSGLLSIDGRQLSRIFHVDGDASQSEHAINLTLEGLTITGGRPHSAVLTSQYEANGGAILFDAYGALSASDVRLTGNSTIEEYAAGGAVFSSAGRLVFRNSELTDNWTSGAHADGGAIASEFGSVSIYDSSVSGNETTGSNASGGSISVHLESLTLTGSLISQNRTVGDGSAGGAIYARSGNVFANRSALIRNTTLGRVSNGGAIYSRSGAVSLRISELSDNITEGDRSFGGAIDTTDGDIRFVAVTAERNRTLGASSGGGAISTSRGDVTVANSLVSGNAAEGLGSSGGAIRTYRDSAVTIESSTLTNNSVASLTAAGAVIHANEGSLRILNSTLVANSATGEESFGGAISIGSSESDLTVYNSLLSGNIAATSPEIHLGDPAETEVDIQSSLLGEVAQDLLTDVASNHTNVDWTDILESHTVDGILAPRLRDNGGPTRTAALIDSMSNIAIDGGDNQLLSVGSVFDQRGATRVASQNSEEAGTVDIGAFEFNPPTRLDFGDGPSGYAVTLDNDGARHEIGSLFLGQLVDEESDGVPTIDSSGDAVSDDGVTPVTSLIASAAVDTRSSLVITASLQGRLDGWIDFNNDGDWDDPGEQIYSSIEVFAGSNAHGFSIPAGATVGDAVARLRLSPFGGLTPTGTVINGEVEDYRLKIDAAGGNKLLFAAQPDTPLRVLPAGQDFLISQGADDQFRLPATELTSVTIQGTSSDDFLYVSGRESVVPGKVHFSAGGGTDTVILSYPQHFNDAGTFDHVNGVEIIDLSGFRAETLRLSEFQILALPDTGRKLRILLDDDDSLQLLADTSSNADNKFLIEQPFTEDGKMYFVARSDNASIEVSGIGWTNPILDMDVDNSGTVELIDALQILNQMRKQQYTVGETNNLIDPLDLEHSHPLKFYDTSRDSKLTPIDALRVLNRVAASAASSEIQLGNSSSVPPFAISTDRLLLKDDNHERAGYPESDHELEPSH